MIDLKNPELMSYLKVNMDLELGREVSVGMQVSQSPGHIGKTDGRDEHSLGRTLGVRRRNANVYRIHRRLKDHRVDNRKENCHPG